MKKRKRIDTVKAVYRLEENGNLTFISRTVHNDLTDPIDVVRRYLERESIPCDEIRVRSDGVNMTAAGMNGRSNHLAR